MSKSAVERRAILPIAKKLHSSITEWGWNAEEAEEKEDEDANPKEREKEVEKKFKHVKILLFLTGIYYAKAPTSFLGKGIQLIKEIVCGFVVFGLAIYKLNKIIKSENYNEKTLPQICLINWLWQAFFSILFLIYWQRRGYIQILFEEVCWPSISKKYSKSRGAIHGILIGVFCVIVFTLCCPLIFYAIFDLNNLYKIRADIDTFTVFGSFWLFFTITTYAGIFYHIILSFYMIVSLTVYYELKGFNEELKELGNNTTISEEEFDAKFMGLYLTHAKLGSMVRAVDNFFEVYTFVLIGLNIPLTIFTLLNTFVSFHSALDAAVSAPLIIFCLGELVGLTLIPAKLHEAIQCVEGIIYGSARVWNPYNEKIYQIATVFISHVRQSNLGISLWGFAVLTKPTILTTCSITLTYLAVLIELKSNSTRFASPAGNATATTTC